MPLLDGKQPRRDMPASPAGVLGKAGDARVHAAGARRHCGGPGKQDDLFGRCARRRRTCVFGAGMPMLHLDVSAEAIDVVAAGFA